jgi:catechol 2,3-dioxygenase
MSFANGKAEVRRSDGVQSDGREPIDVEDLLRSLTPEDGLDEPMPHSTRIGHIHLHVANLDTSMRFYHELLGFDNMGITRSFRMGMVSTGGYHHHIGFNTWVGENAPPQPAGALGMYYFTIKLPNQAELDRVIARIREAKIVEERSEEGIIIRDPSQNSIFLTAAPELNKID